MENQISIFDKVADPIVAIERMGTWLAMSGMFGCTKPEQGMVIAMHCMTMRISPVELMRTYHIIEGKLSMKSDAMLAGFQTAGGTVKWIQYDDKASIADFTFQGTTNQISFTLEDAKKAGLYPGKPDKNGNPSNWSKRPDAMLRARLISKAVRMIAPTVNAGIYTPEEVAEFDAKPVIETASVKARLAAPIVNPQAPAPEPVIERKKAESFQAACEKYLIDNNALETSIKFLRAKKVLKPEQVIADLAEKHAVKILEEGPVFLAKLGDFTKAGGK